MSEIKETFLPEMGGKGAIPINFTDIDNLIGKLLTIVDATFTDKEQREAQKSVIKSIVRDWGHSRYDYLPSIDWSFKYNPESRSSGDFSVTNVYQPFSSSSSTIN